MILFLSLITFFLNSAWAKSPNLCDILDLKNCEGVTKQGRRTSVVSYPSPTTSVGMNPATVSFDRGIGIEAIQQANNPVVFGLASGTGKFGGALISSSLENTFFGNRVYELDDAFLKRQENKKQYKTQKISLAVGGKLTRKNNFALDIGLIAKRHSEIKKINPGIGLSGRFKFITFGASIYQDDFFLDFENHQDPQTGIPYTVLFGQPNYQETFTVKTFSVGTKFGGLALDAGFIQTRYKFDNQNSNISIYSAAYIYRNYMLNFAIRNELNSVPKFEDNMLVEEKSKTSYFGGAQVSIGKHLIVGVNYNYFLLNEFSLITTLFF